MSEPIDDEEARALRARRLREQIEQLVSGEAEPEPPENPRDFIHEKMREWEKEHEDPE